MIAQINKIAVDLHNSTFYFSLFSYFNTIKVPTHAFFSMEFFYLLIFFVAALINEPDN